MRLLRPCNHLDEPCQGFRINGLNTGPALALMGLVHALIDVFSSRSGSIEQRVGVSNASQ